MDNKSTDFISEYAIKGRRKRIQNESFNLWIQASIFQMYQFIRQHRIDAVRALELYFSCINIAVISSNFLTKNPMVSFFWRFKIYRFESTDIRWLDKGLSIAFNNLNCPQFSNLARHWSKKLFSAKLPTNKIHIVSNFKPFQSVWAAKKDKNDKKGR